MHDSPSVRFVPALLLAGAAALPLPAQQTPQSIVTVAVAANAPNPVLGEIYRIDHQANTATKITTPALFDTDRPNCILMTSPVTGLIGTNPTSTTATGNIYDITLGANGVVIGNNGQPLNTTPTAGVNVAQLAIVGTGANARIYFVSQTGGVVGALQSIPLTGGPVRTDYDTANLPTSTLTNALATFGTKLYIGMWSLSATVSGEIIEFDTSNNTAKKLVDLPFSKYKGGAGTSTIGFGCVNAHILPNVQLGVLGIYGDEVRVDIFAGRIVEHRFHGPKTSPNVTNALINSGYYDPTTDDWVIGTRRGSVERWVEDHHADSIIAPIGSHPTATGNSVNGVFHFPVDKNSDKTIGAGCTVSSTGFTPTDVSRGAAVPGNQNFALALYSASPSQPFFMGLGAATIKVPFGNAGCNLLISPLVAIGGTTTAAGTVTLPAPLPASLPPNSFIHRQWVVADGAGGIVLSNARTTTIK